MSEGEADIIFSARAYCKMISHAAKYPHCAINGVLLAKPSKNKTVDFVDAVPLFHISPNLTPMAEVALIQIDEVASKRGLVIAGYYAALENILDNSLEKAHSRIADKIAQNFPLACLVVIENINLSIIVDKVAIKVAQYSDGSFKPCDLNRIYLIPETTLDVRYRLLRRHGYENLVDFDNHLDNVKLDWMNLELNQNIEAIIESFE